MGKSHNACSGTLKEWQRNPANRGIPQQGPGFEEALWRAAQEAMRERCMQEVWKCRGRCVSDSAARSLMMELEQLLIK
jgi:hypothetical protein